MITAIKLNNLGTVNKNAVSIYTSEGGTYSTLYFSYETIVGVISRYGRFISQNDWSTTTGKLLNELEPDKDRRYPHDRVLKEAQRVLREASR